MAGLLELMSAAGGAIALIDRIAENPKARGARPVDPAITLANETRRRYGGSVYWIDSDRLFNRFSVMADGKVIGGPYTDIRNARAALDAVAPLENPKMRAKYTGKYPSRIKAVYAAGGLPKGVALVVTNDGTRYFTRASEANRKLPKVGDDISMYPTREPAKINPQSRSFADQHKQNYRDRLDAAALALLEATSSGQEYPDAEFRIARMYDVKSGDLRQLYDAWHDNPRSRSKRGVTRPSQITKRAPTKRLLKRRKATAKAPAGFFANPVDVNDLRSEGTYTRVTKPMLQDKLAALSKALKAPAWPARGAIGLDMAFNGYRLVQITEGTAEQDLSPRLKAGEMANFLDGALMVAKAVR